MDETLDDGRSPHGERGLKSTMSVRWAEWNCRSPHGERGLKFLVETVEHILRESLSSRRAWIEIRRHRKHDAARCVALLTESVD